MSYGAGAVGLNLQFANYVFLFDRWWNPAVEDQAINRAHRIGASGPTTVTRFLALDTIEERIDRVLQEKRELFETIFSGAKGPGKLGLTHDELFGLFALPSAGQRETRGVIHFQVTAPWWRQEPQPDHRMPAKLVEMLLQDPADFHHGQGMRVHGHVKLRHDHGRLGVGRTGAVDAHHAVGMIAQRVQPRGLRNLADDVVVLDPRRPRAGLHHRQDRRTGRQRVDAGLDLQERFREEHLGIVAEELLLGIDDRLRAGESACPEGIASSGWRTLLPPCGVAMVTTRRIDGLGWK